MNFNSNLLDGAGDVGPVTPTLPNPRGVVEIPSDDETMDDSRLVLAVDSLQSTLRVPSTSGTPRARSGPVQQGNGFTYNSAVTSVARTANPSVVPYRCT